MAASNLGEVEASRAYARESLRIARERHDKRQIEWALRTLSFNEPDLKERRRLLDECEQILQELGSEAGLGWVTYLRGFVSLEEGDPNAAIETLTASAALFRRLGRRWETVNAELEIGYALILAGRRAEALPRVIASLIDAVDGDAPSEITEGLVLVGAHVIDSDPATATRLLAKARAIAHEEGNELDPLLGARLFATTEQSARAQLGTRFDAEWEAGSKLTLDEAVALARDAE
jgi:hypothetical protein